MITALEVKIPFHNDTITAFVDDNGSFVAIKPICETLGFSWSAQLQSIKRDPVLSKGMCTMHTPSKGGNQKMVCLPLRLLHGWLFKINPMRYDGNRQDKIVTYQLECFDVLYNYFNHGGAINPEASNQQLLILQAQVEHYKQFAPDVPYGTLSEVNSRERKFPHKGYFQSPPRKPDEVRRQRAELQPDLPNL